MTITALLSVVYGGLLLQQATAKSAAEWVTESRLVEGAYSAEQTYRITVNADCTSSIVQNAAPVTGPIALASGAAAVVEICSAQGAGAHYFTSPSLFNASAFRKAQVISGYGKADVFQACEAFDGQCCSMFFVPVVDGTYSATDDSCADAEVAQIVVSGNAGTLEQDTSDAWVPAANRDAAVAGAASGDWPGWQSPTTIEVTLVEQPSCGVPAAAPAARLPRRLFQATEGDGEDIAAEREYQWVYTMGHTGVMSSLAPAVEGGEGEGEGAEGSATPAANEGADGVFEGMGEGEGSATPAANEGADGVFEGMGEGEGSATPAANEGADGVFEGMGEGEGSATPAANEGADGVFEGMGEGEGSATPAANEGADGVFEGMGEGEGSATPAANEGADGVEEGMGEGMAAGRKLLQTPAADEGADGVFEGMGEGEGSATPAADEGADGVFEGMGEGEGSASANTVFDVVDAVAFPIEMVRNQGYIIRFNLVRSTANHYFTAPELFINSVVRKFQDIYAEYKFQTYPLEFELFDDSGTVDMYVVPTVAGEYPLTSGSLPAESLTPGVLRVVETEADLTPPAEISTIQVTRAACSSPAAPEGTVTEGEGAAPAAGAGGDAAAPAGDAAGDAAGGATPEATSAAAAVWLSAAAAALPLMTLLL